MQEIVYRCDNCNKVLGLKKHISFRSDGMVNGIANPPENKGRWFVKITSPAFVHLCSGNCAKEFFDKQLKPESKKK